MQYTISSIVIIYILLKLYFFFWLYAKYEIIFQLSKKQNKNPYHWSIYKELNSFSSCFNIKPNSYRKLFLSDNFGILYRML